MLIKKELKKIPNCDCPEFTAKEIKKCKHIIAVKVHNDILVADYFTTDGFNLQARFFCDKKNFITYFPKEDKWEKRALTTLFMGEIDIPSHEKSEDIAVDFLELQKYEWQGDYWVGYHRYKGAHGAICSFVSKKFEEKNNKARENKEFRMQQDFSLFPKFYNPDVMKYLENYAFKSTYIFFSKLNKKHQRTAICGHCGKRFSVPKDIKHKQITQCPKCRKSAQYFADWYTPKEQKVTLCYPFVVDGKLLMEWSEAIRSFENKKPRFCYSPFARQITFSERGKQKTKSYGISPAPFYWGPHWCSWGNSPVYRKSFVYPNDLISVYGEDYHNINLKFLLKEDVEPIDFSRVTNNLQQFKITEYLIKLGLFNFAESKSIDSLNYNGNNFSEVFGVRQNYLQLYQKHKVTMSEHLVISYCKEFINEDLLLKFRASKMYEYCGTFSELLEKVSLTRLMNYVDKQSLIYPDRSVYQILTWVKDYVSMNEYLGVIIDRKNIFPADIKVAHDKTLPRYNIVLNERFEQESKEALSLINNFFDGYSDDKYAVVVPKTRKDFIKEGNELSHCVGSEHYYKNHIKGDKMIFFIRRTEDIQKSYVTAEIDMHRFIVLQLYGYGDSPAPKDVRKFTTGFSNWLKRNKSVMSKAG